ncbi:MAG TPA: zinc-ribbon domain-containing protein [Pyrinomonadaceae bacterium]|nr:zinc-ribbon domain-containing protein [Pyrinomonadaceae bacterium]
MFCPRCAAQNSDDTKFCRACGTNLATVSLVLSDPQQLSTATLERVASISSVKRRDGILKLIQGSGWIGASTIVGVALGLFSNTNDWIFVWLGLASWMACLGIIQWSQGINKLIEARYLSREMGLAAADSSPATQQLRKGEAAALPAVPNTNELAQPGSVADGTTELLNR